jgi:hypothetical protein
MLPTTCSFATIFVVLRRTPWCFWRCTESEQQVRE